MSDQHGLTDVIRRRCARWLGGGRGLIEYFMEAALVRLCVVCTCVVQRTDCVYAMDCWGLAHVGVHACDCDV